MKTSLFCFLLAVFVGSMALPQTTTTTAKTPSKKTGTTKATSKTGTATATKKGTATVRTASTTSSGARKKTASKKKAVPAPARQMSPTTDRYREIQQALADKGYLKTQPNGVWDDQSSEALKQFQNDKHLSPTGKISSMSLIDLGLGPRPPNSPVLPSPSALQGAQPAQPTDLPPAPETIPVPQN
jgi:hypothetical protein